MFLGQLYAQRHADGYATLWQWHPGTWVEVLTIQWTEFGGPHPTDSLHDGVIT